MIEPRWSELLGVHYITIKGTHITSTGVLLTQPELSDLKGQPDKVRELYVQRLQRTLYDYDYARRTGIIRQSLAPTPTVLQSAIDDQRTTLDEVTPQEMPKDNRAINIPIRILRVTMLVVALLCIPISTFNIYEATVQSLPKFVSLVFAVALSVFVTGSFESVFLMWRNNKVLACFLAVFCSLAIAYAMSSTLESFYRGYANKRVESQQLVEDTVRENLSGKAERAAKRTALALEQYVKAKDEYEALTDDASVAAWRKAVASKVVDAKKAEYDKALLDEDSVDDRATVAASQIVENTKDFYDKVDETFNWKSGKAHMLISFIPTVFIDIIAPLSTAVALFLDDKTTTTTRNTKEKTKWGTKLLAVIRSRKSLKNQGSTT